jgi:pimeloyl-ACP methyl ester carboxylesterase
MLATILLAASITLKPCDLRNLKAQCGTLAVPETKRTIDLNIAVIPATTKHDDALFVIAGGPGAVATNMAGFANRSFAAGQRDIVLVDARGTGKSHPLHCANDSPLFSDLMDPERLAQCRDELSKTSDLTQYTTLQVVEDLEAVRKALGYTQVTLYGTSYGTRVAQEYMRRHPKSVRAAILDGVVPPSLAMPSRYAVNAQRTLSRVFDLCRADAACAKAFPDPEFDLATFTIYAEKGLEMEGTVMKRGFFGEAMRNFLYSPEQYTRLPYVVHAAANNDLRPFATLATQYANGIRSLDLGFFLSVTCAEDIPRLDVEKERAAAKGTLLGAYRLNQQVGACKVWPRAKTDAAMSQPVRSAIPTLLVSGELDPVTPPEYGDEVAKTLTHSLHVVLPGGSHSGDTGGCVEKVISEFIRKGSVDALDTSCVKSFRRPPFVITEQPSAQTK